MGESTGKAEAIMDYAAAMGLITVEAGATRASKRPILTLLGRTIYREDRQFGERISQWLVHLNLCRNDIGARAWHETFGRGYRVLGSSFSKRALEDHLSSVFGSGPNRIGPLLSTYTDDAALGRADVLRVAQETVCRNAAPLLDSCWMAYSAVILTLFDVFFPNETQVTLSDFASTTCMFDVCLWGRNEVEYALGQIERRGFVTTDRQMRPWILERNSDTDSVWARIFQDIS